MITGGCVGGLTVLYRYIQAPQPEIAGMATITTTTTVRDDECNTPLIRGEKGDLVANANIGVFQQCRLSLCRGGRSGVDRVSTVKSIVLAQSCSRVCSVLFVVCPLSW